MLVALELTFNSSPLTSWVPEINPYKLFLIVYKNSVLPD